MCKIIFLTDQFQVCFCFCIGNTKQPYLFMHWQQNWHHYRQLASCYICFVLSLHSGISCSCRIIFQSSYFCVLDVEKLWFWMCLRQAAYQCCVILPVFLRWVIGVFNSPVATPAHGLLGLSLSLRLRFISENASMLALYIYATTHCPTPLSC